MITNDPTKSLYAILAIFVISVIIAMLFGEDIKVLLSVIVFFGLYIATFYIRNKIREIFIYPYEEKRRNEWLRKRNKKKRTKRRSISENEILFTPAREKRSSIVMINSVVNSNSEEKSPKMKVKEGFVFVPELGREVRTCCYQSARIGDRYCVCGRVVDDDLLSLFHPEVRST